ncbi:MAG: J domain-containing protein [Pseudomonadota bacterium]
MPQDLYSILGVTKSASADEIRRAYKQRAKDLHPDLHPNDSSKADRFKQVSAAYEILSDGDKRRQYDSGQIDERGEPKGFSGSGWPGGNPGGYQQAGGFQGEAFDDILSGLFGGGRRRPGPERGADMRYRVEIAFEDAVQGAKRDMTMADGKTITVSIPAGIETGKVLRLKSQGRPSRTGGPPGDALLEVVVRDSEIWTRDGDDLRMAVPIPLSIAVLGGAVEVQTPSGPITLKVPEGSNTGAVLRLRNKGVQKSGKPGHLYARLEINIENPKDPDLRAWAKKASG